MYIAQPSSCHMKKQLPSSLAFSSSSSSSSCLVSYCHRYQLHHHHHQLLGVRRTLPGQDLPQKGGPPHPPDHQTRSVWKPKRLTITITWGLESKRPPRNLACLWAGWVDKSTGGKGLCCQISINRQGKLTNVTTIDLYLVLAYSKAVTGKVAFHCWQTDRTRYR